MAVYPPPCPSSCNLHQSYCNISISCILPNNSPELHFTWSLYLLSNPIDFPVSQVAMILTCAPALGGMKEFNQDRRQKLRKNGIKFSDIPDLANWSEDILRYGKLQQGVVSIKTSLCEVARRQKLFHCFKMGLSLWRPLFQIPKLSARTGKRVWKEDVKSLLQGSLLGIALFQKKTLDSNQKNSLW